MSAVNYKTCFVPSCSFNNKEYPGKFFFRVPATRPRRVKWFLTVGRSTSNMPTSKSLYCCEEHFNLPEDVMNYFIFLQVGGSMRLKVNVVPRFNLGYSNHSDSKEHTEHFAEIETITESGGSPVAKKLRLQEQNLGNHSDSTESELDQAYNIQSTPKPSDKQEIFLLTEDSAPHCTEHVDSFQVISQLQCKGYEINCDNQSYRSVSCANTVDKEVQCNLVEENKECSAEIFNISDSLQEMNIGKGGFNASSSTNITAVSSNFTKPSDTTCSSYAPSEKEKLELLLNKVYSEVTSTVIEADPLLFLGLPRHALFFLQEIAQCFDIPMKNIHLTLKKIRQNHSDATLVYDFGYSERHVGRIFTSTCKKLVIPCGKMVFWPSKIVIQQNLPIAFRYRFKNVHSGKF